MADFDSINTSFEKAKICEMIKNASKCLRASQEEVMYHMLDNEDVREILNGTLTLEDLTDIISYWIKIGKPKCS